MTTQEKPPPFVRLCLAGMLGGTNALGFWALGAPDWCSALYGAVGFAWTLAWPTPGGMRYLTPEWIKRRWRT